MFDRLPFEDHQIARTLAREAAAGFGASERRLTALLARRHPDLGERYVCPSGQTVAALADAVAAWRA